MGDEFTLAYATGWTPLVMALLVFVLVARPWRALGRTRVDAR